MPPLLFIAACAGIVIAPFLFESYTFHLYAAGDPDFFVFSGARLWVFLGSELGLGFAIGRVSRLPLYAAAGCVAAAILALTLLLYQFCDDRQCYYSGPDGISWLRLAVLLFAAAATGLLMGSRSRKEPARKSNISAILFGVTTAVFLGYYPVALLFGTFMTYQLAFAILAFASSVPFLFGGIASSLFSDRARHAAYSAIAGWAALSALFAGLRPEGAPLLAAMIAAEIPAAALGHRAARRVQKEPAIAAVFASMIALFALAGAHPFLDAPMNMAVNDGRGAIVQPTYYAGAYHNEQYFPTKRVEVEIDLGRFDGDMIGKDDFVTAGIGAQSPNCCKDGLDYGYRADILFTESGRYLVARAWESCDQNIGCSALPWISPMHESTIPLPNNGSSVMIAMEWARDDATVNWYYRTGGNWLKYSSFLTPEIENPYFNLGVIWVGNPFSNPDSSRAYFYQAGVSTPSEKVEYGQITFECPAYYDNQGEKQCPQFTAVERANSQWKVLWKWGLQNENASIAVHGTSVTVG
jgi:hypothetical protein